MHMCGKCLKMHAGLLLLAGILFLLVDVGVWGFWGLNWWTVVLLIFGVSHFGSASCKDCAALRKKR